MITRDVIGAAQIYRMIFLALEVETVDYLEVSLLHKMLNMGSHETQPSSQKLTLSMQPT